VLRSRLSPEVVRYRVTLPAGAVLRGVGGGAVVSEAGSVIARIAEPVARDAQDSVVTATMTVSGDELVVHISHRSLDVRVSAAGRPTVTVTGSGAGGSMRQDMALSSRWGRARSRGQTDVSGVPCVGADVDVDQRHHGQRTRVDTRRGRRRVMDPVALDGLL